MLAPSPHPPPSQALAGNKSVTEIIVSDNNITEEGGSALAEVVRQHPTTAPSVHRPCSLSVAFLATKEYEGESMAEHSAQSSSLLAFIKLIVDTFM